LHKIRRTEEAIPEAEQCEPEKVVRRGKEHHPHIAIHIAKTMMKTLNNPAPRLKSRFLKGGRQDSAHIWKLQAAKKPMT
jgi:hypothetical protein